MRSARSVWLMVAGVMIGILLIVGWILFEARRSRTFEQPVIQEVNLKHGDSDITINRRGTVTVRLPEGVFQQQWDEERVAQFFAKFESQDFSSFAEYGSDFEGYHLTVTTSDGEVKSYILPFIDVPMPEVIEEIVKTLEEISKALPTPTPTPAATPTPIISLPTPTPTPTPYQPPPLPTPTPSGQEDGVVQRLFECEFTGPDSSLDILSQTVCSLIY